MDEPGAKRRSSLPKPEAMRRYVDRGQLAALRQIRRDSEALDARALAVGPFARLDANAVAAEEGKTRGAVTNLFGSQAAFQAQTMERALNARDWIERLEYPAPSGFASADDWVDAVFSGESARGPRRGAEPAIDYAFLWALWLSAVPYGLWSERIRGSTMEEHVQWVAKLEQSIRDALDHFGLTLRDGASAADLACAWANLIEGAWLNQCLSPHHPLDPSEPIATVLRKGGRLLWQGAVDVPR
jgi:hypothetical protein